MSNHSDSLSTSLLDWKQKGTRITVNGYGHQVFVVDIGSPSASADATLVVFHGYPESSHSYVDALPLFLERFERVVMWDFIGFGFSDKPSKNFTYSVFSQADIALQVMKHCQIRGAHMLSHDFGDTVLTEVLHLIHSCSPSWFDIGLQSVTFTNGGMVLAEYNYRFTQLLLPTEFGKWMSRFFNHKWLFEQQVNSAHGNRLLSQSKIDDMYALLNYRAFPELLHHLNLYQNERRKFEQSRWLEVLRKINVPINVSWSLDDQVNPIGIALYLKNHVQPNINLITVPGLGHFGEVQNAHLWWTQGVGQFY